MVRKSTVFSMLMVQCLLLVFPPSAYSSAWCSTRQTQGTSWWGGANPVNFSRTITVHPWFLDVEEDIEIGTYGSPPPNNLSTLEFTGTFTLPLQSVITGVLIWDGDNILKGKLKGKADARNQYEDVVDRNTSPPPRLRDPVIIEKTDRLFERSRLMDAYTFNIYPVAWGKSRKIRIRYLCPISHLDGKLGLPLHQTFDFGNWHPSRNAPVTIKGAEGISSVRLISVNMQGITIENSVLKLPSRCTEPILANYYQQLGLQELNLYLIVEREENALLATTSFPDGAWKGNYTMFWGSPPDSLLMDAGLRREVVFLWKWNFWHTFVVTSDTGKKVSPFGADAIAQARTIANVAGQITAAGDKVGLLLEKGSPEENKLFPLCKQNSAAFDTLQSFLGGIDSSYMTSTITGTTSPIDIRIAEAERENFFRQGAQSFDVSLKLVCSIFSKNEKVIKHIVLVSAGPVPEMANLEDYYLKSDSLLGKKVTISAIGNSQRYPSGYWPGVPTHRIVEAHALTAHGAYVGGIWLPEWKKRFYSMTIESGTNSYNYDLVNLFDRKSWDAVSQTYQTYVDTFTYDVVSFAGHSLSSWKRDVIWKAYDEKWTLLATHRSQPYTIDKSEDTALAKLWAGSIAPVSDTTFTANRGARYGIVDENYSLLALEEDTVSKALKADLAAGGLPYLNDDEIFIPENNGQQLSVVRQRTEVIVKKPIIRVIGGRLQLQLPPGMKSVSMRIYNLAGRVVFEVPTVVRFGAEPILLAIPAQLTRGVYTIAISGGGSKCIQKITLP